MKDKKTLNSELSSLNYYVIIFDCDGVIVDDRSTYHVAIHRTINFFMKKLGFPFFRKNEIIDFKFKKGINNDWDLIVFAILNRAKMLKGKLNIKKACKILKERFNLSYDDIISKFDESYFDIKNREKLFLKSNFFKKLKDRCFVLGIVSGRVKKDLLDTLKRFSLKKYFLFIYTEDDVPNIKYRKPHPYLLDRAIKEHSKKEDRIIFVGDSIADKKMAENSKYRKRIEFIGVDFAKKNIFRKAAKNVRELEKMILKYA